MVNINNVVLAGRLTRDPNIKTLNNGVMVAELSMALNRYFKKRNGEDGKDVCFVDVVMYDSAANTVSTLAKGDGIFVEGNLKLDKWEDKDGNKRSKLYVRANNFAKIEKIRNDDDNYNDDEKGTEF